ncbi:hypothetical protein IGI04_040569 [Brassica rapa subsp. trilocularis]|uniref:Uncharacterized protein n=1 Tax=Brassica rapa subsp. trilocularis TaxID=1813537 RepID=A0ABQ7KSE0_BRACM|nr:hypothetical protein IGI04_040569 [Brassica rapa subsp. trilocularis]
MNREKHNSRKENPDDHRPPKRHKQDSKIDLPNKRLTPASGVTAQTQQPVHNTNLLADVTNSNDLLQRNARTQRLIVLRQKRKVSAIDDIRNTPTKRTTQESSNSVLTDGQLNISNNETQNSDISTVQLTGNPTDIRINSTQETTQTTMKCSRSQRSSVKNPVGRPRLPLIKPYLSGSGGNSVLHEGSGSKSLPTLKRSSKDPPIVHISQKVAVGKLDASGSKHGVPSDVQNKEFMTPLRSFQNSTIGSSGVTQCSLAKTVHRYNHSPVDTTNICCTQNRSTGKSIISSLDSDSSDYEDCWDCSSNEDNADWGTSDTDSEDEYVLEIKCHAYTKKVASCFAQLFGDLPEVLHSSITSPVESAPIEEGT